MQDEPNRIVLIGYLEEALPSEEMAKIEEKLRQSEDWRQALREVMDEVGSGDHSLATIWRRHRLTCPSRDRLGAHVGGGLGPEESDYIDFHLTVIKCRLCLANLADIKGHANSTLAKEAADPSPGRRRRFFETSVGHLPPGTRGG